MRILRNLLVAFVLSSFPLAGMAQNTTLSVNGGDLLTLGTLNARFSYAFARRWNVQAEARWNPWTFKAGTDGQSQLRHRTFSAGARFWPWYVNSGWFIGSSLQYQEYNRGGFNGRLATEEGDAFGLTVEAGYAFMLSHRFNLEVGLAGWGGYTRYTAYGCSYCGRVTGKGGKAFFLPDRLIIAFCVVL